MKGNEVVKEVLLTVLYIYTVVFLHILTTFQHCSLNVF